MAAHDLKFSTRRKSNGIRWTYGGVACLHAMFTSGYFPAMNAFLETPGEQLSAIRREGKLSNRPPSWVEKGFFPPPSSVRIVSRCHSIREGARVAHACKGFLPSGAMAIF